MHSKRSGTNTRRLLACIIVGGLYLLCPPFKGCEPEDMVLQTNCADCLGSEPDSADLIVYVTIDQEYDSVPLTFYRGSYEDGMVDWQDTATTEKFYLYSEMDREYAVKATYQSGNETIIAFDGDKMYTYDAGDECGSPCYIVKGGIFDLRLLN